MKGNARILDLLNQLLTNELTSVHQYLAHAGLCAHWGYHRLAEHVHAEVEDERKHADALLARILFLDGAGDVQKVNKVNVGQTVRQQLEFDLALEYAAVKLLNSCIEESRAAGDHGTFSLLIDILKAEESHADWLETQLELMKQLGEPFYLSQQMKG